jgi:hypothetical protein
MDSSGQHVMTVVSAIVAPDRVSELTDGYREMARTTLPDGLIRSELLRGQDGKWRIESVWRDLNSLQAVRASGQRPAALELFERVGAEHSHEFYFVEAAYSV